MNATNLALDHEFAERLKKIPMFDTLPFHLHSAANGQAEMSLGYETRFNGVFDSMHGGFLMTLADTAACVAVLTLAGKDARVTTTDMNIRFLAACRTEARAVAKIVKFGSTMVPVNVEMFDANGTLVAISQVNYMRLKR